MGSEWPVQTLKKSGVALIDCVHKTPKAVEQGYPYIGIPQMKAGRIDFEAGPRLIAKSDLEEWTKKANPLKDDVVLSRRCNPGETAHVSGQVKFALGQNWYYCDPILAKFYQTSFAGLYADHSGGDKSVSI